MNTEEIVHHEAEELLEHQQKPGEAFFALLFAVFSVALLAQIGEQTKWVDGVGFMMQPRAWPLISLSGMTLFALPYLVTTIQKQRAQTQYRFFQLDEIGTWLLPIEYAVYFLIYVYVVPIAGYLAATIALCFLLTLRTGYRSKNMLLASVGVAIGIVLLFKTFLKVKIPGGSVYEVFPDAIRNFLITYF